MLSFSKKGRRGGADKKEHKASKLTHTKANAKSGSNITEISVFDDSSVLKETRSKKPCTEIASNNPCAEFAPCQNATVPLFNGPVRYEVLEICPVH